MVSETITLEGHIIDSRALSDVLDDIITFGGDFEMLEVHIGRRKLDRSHARIEVFADSEAKLTQIMAQLTKRGALIESASDAELTAADLDGAFPEEFYCTSNEPTQIRHGGTWREVHDQEMDCGIRYDAATDAFRCVPMEHVRRNDLIVCGQRGIRLEPVDRAVERGTFQFMATEISTEKPQKALIRHVAEEMAKLRAAGKKIVLVGGAAIIHTDSVEHVVRLIQRDYVNLLVATNALAVHDVELALFGTSLGIYVEKAAWADTGHEHPLRAINAIRRAGGIEPAVASELLSEGILHACVQKGVPFHLIASVRDDAPMPETINDMLAAQEAISGAVRDAAFVLMVASSRLSIATAYILPAATPVVGVDINPAVLHKVRDRGTYQTMGLVTDAESFFRELIEGLDAVEAG